MAKINFDAASHEYRVANKLYTSTTQLMKKYGLSPDYGTIPAAVLLKASKKGNAVHKALEEFIKGDLNMVTLFKEVELFNNHCVLTGMDPHAMIPEAVVFDQQYEIAGTLDVQYIHLADDIIADFKTTAQLHMDAVAWQLSIYNYLVVKGDMIAYYFKQLKVFHFTQGRLYVKNVRTVDFDAVVALLETHKRRDKVFNYVKPNLVILPTEETYLLQLLHEKKQLKEALNKIEDEEKLLLGRLKDNFKKHKEYSYRQGELSITYTDGTNKSSFSQSKAKEFIKDNGGDIDDFMSHSTGAPKASARLVKPLSGNNVDPADIITPF